MVGKLHLCSWWNPACGSNCCSTDSASDVGHCYFHSSRSLTNFLDIVCCGASSLLLGNTVDGFDSNNCWQSRGYFQINATSGI